jgi:hypothetical protein
MTPILLLLMFLAAPPATGATIYGTVTDASGKPLRDARVDHTGAMVVVASPGLALKPSPEETRTDADGHFRVTTVHPAIVVRQPGFESQRLRVTGDAQVNITLQPIRNASRCKVTPPAHVRTKEANDIDYRATWFYIRTKEGLRGIISGSGPTYSLGAPSDSDVWASVEYSEVMYQNGVIDAAGHSADGKYWRIRTKFGAAAQYYNVDRATAEQLDCVMDGIRPGL